jgi:hypothetical protein
VLDVCDADPVPAAAVPSPVTPSSEVPSPVVPRSTAPTPVVSSAPASSVEFPVAEVPELDADEEDDEVAMVPGLVEEFVTPELLTELHGPDMPVPAAAAPGCADVAELAERLIPPPSNGDGGTVPRFPAEQGAAGLPVPEKGMAVPWELPTGSSNSAPSGDVDPMPPDKGALVCAVLRPMPSTRTARTRDAATKGFIEVTVGCAASQPFPNTDPGLAGETGVSGEAGTVYGLDGLKNRRWR